MSKPSWRKIESVLIELLREEGFEIEQERGNHFICVAIPGVEDPIEVCLADFAQQLEERL